MGLEIRNTYIPKFPIGSKVKVKLSKNSFGIDAIYHGVVTKHLDEFDTFNGKHHHMVQLNNDEFHTYYVDFVESVLTIK